MRAWMARGSRFSLVARTHLLPQNCVVRQPVDKHRSLGQHGNLGSDLHLFGSAVLNHGRTS